MERGIIVPMTGGQFHLNAATYLDQVRSEISQYDEFQDAVVQASASMSVRSILELGIGTGETARRVLLRHPGASLLALDASRDMVTVASGVLPRAEVRVATFEDALPQGPFDLVISALAVHHLNRQGKADLFVRVARVLRVGGRFILGDVIVPNDPNDAVIPLEPHVDLPDRLEDQLSWLSDAGLPGSVVWRQKDLAVVAADRTE